MWGVKAMGGSISAIGLPSYSRGQDAGGITTASVATYSAPLPAVHVRDGLPRVVHAVLLLDDNEIAFIVVDEMGKQDLARMTELTIDWRYDHASERWTDANGAAPDSPFGGEQGG